MPVFTVVSCCILSKGHFHHIRWFLACVQVHFKQACPVLITRNLPPIEAGRINRLVYSATMWAGQRSRYSGWLRAGRSGDRVPVGGDIFRTCPDRPWDPPSLLYNMYRVFPGGKERPGRDADPSPTIAVVKKGQSYTSAPPMDRTACSEPQCLYKGALYLYLTVPLTVLFRFYVILSKLRLTSLF